jgi:hypothetical protein
MTINVILFGFEAAGRLAVVMSSRDLCSVFAQVLLSDLFHCYQRNALRNRMQCVCHKDIIVPVF